MYSEESVYKIDGELLKRIKKYQRNNSKGYGIQVRKKQTPEDY